MLDSIVGDMGNGLCPGLDGHPSQALQTHVRNRSTLEMQATELGKQFQILNSIVADLGIADVQVTKIGHFSEALQTLVCNSSGLEMQATELGEPLEVFKRHVRNLTAAQAQFSELTSYDAFEGLVCRSPGAILRAAILLKKSSSQRNRSQGHPGGVAASISLPVSSIW